MLNIYLIRHGKAMAIGSNYDNLSETGCKQASLLGKYFSKNSIIPNYIITGTLKRQKKTAQAIVAEIDVLSENKPKLEWLEQESLNEIKIKSWLLIQNYLEKKDKDFAELRKKRDSLGAEITGGALFKKIGQNVLKKWTEIESGHNIAELKGIEIFNEFYNQTIEIFNTLKSIDEKNKNKTINVFMISSGTPIALLCGNILGLEASHSLSLAIWIYNSSCSKIFYNDNDFQLVSFNNLAHLDGTNLLTLI